MSSINSRIKYLVDAYCGGNNSEFANKIGINEANVRNYLNGTEPKFNVIEKIAKNFEINFEWLIFGKGEVEKPKIQKKLHNDSVTKSVTKSVKNQKYKKSYTNEVLPEESQYNEEEYHSILRKLKFADGVDIAKEGAPFYPLPVTAGDNEQFFETQKEKPTGYISLPGVSCKAYFPVVGFSFEPIIRAGDVIGIDFVDRWERLDPDSIYFIITQDQRMIKRLVDDPEDPDRLICISPNFREFTIWKEEIKVIHKVIFYGRLV